MEKRWPGLCLAFVIACVLANIDAIAAERLQPVPSRELRSSNGAYPMAAEFHAPQLRNGGRVLHVARPKSLPSAGAAKPPLGREQIAWPGRKELKTKSKADRSPIWTMLDSGVVGWIQVQSQGAAALRLGLRLSSAAGVVVTVTGSGDAALGIPPQRLTDTQLAATAGSIVWTPVTSGEWQYVEVYLPGRHRCFRAAQ